MLKLQRQVRIASILCRVAFAAGVVGHLALIDIFHGETDVRVEWRALQIAGVVVAAALLLAAQTLSRILAAMTNHASGCAPHSDR
jgi:hypothetical protein